MYQTLSNILDKKENKPENYLYSKLVQIQTLSSVIINTLLGVPKIYLGLHYHSMTIVGDGVDTLINILLSVLVFFTYYLFFQKESIRYPFGKGRIIYISQLIIALLFISIAFGLFQITLKQLVSGNKMEFHYTMFIIIFISIFFNEWLARFCFFIARRFDSSVMRLEGLHNRFDNILSVITLCVIVSSYFNLKWFDIIGSFFFALLILKTAFSILKKNIDQLLGGKPEIKDLDLIIAISKQQDSILGVHEIIIHNYGYNKIINCHVEIDENLSLKEAHKICDTLENSILQKTGFITVTHPDPSNANSPMIQKIHKQINLTIKNIPLLKASIVQATHIRFDSQNPTVLIFDIFLKHQLTSDEKSTIVQLLETPLKNTFEEISSISASFRPLCGSYY